MNNPYVDALSIFLSGLGQTSSLTQGVSGIASGSDNIATAIGMLQIAEGYASTHGIAIAEIAASVARMQCNGIRDKSLQ